LELLLDVVNEVLVARISMVTETGGDEIVTNASIISGAANITEKKILKRELIAQTKITKLIFNRLTDYLLMDLKSARKAEKGKMLQNIFDLLAARSAEKPPLAGNFLMKANRVLMSHKFTEDGVLVDLSIIRNDTCDGLIIHCTPLAGIYNAGGHTAAAGPITLLLHDKELAVLLINQYGLYVLSRSKWSSLEMVARWLSGRLIVRKVKTLDTSNFEEEEEGAQEEDSFFGDMPGMNGSTSNMILEEPSFISQVTFDHTTKVGDGPDGGGGGMNVTAELGKLTLGDWPAPAEGTATGVAIPVNGGGSGAGAGAGAGAFDSLAPSAAGSLDGDAGGARAGTGTRTGAGALTLSMPMVKSLSMPGFMDTFSPSGGGRRGKTPGSAMMRPGTGFSAAGSPLLRGRSQQGGGEGGGMGSSSRQQRMLSMLDVQLDRRVDVSNNLQVQWKSRNTPSIIGMEVAISAWQDLEMLVVKVTLTLPLPHRFNLMKRKKAQEANKADDLMNMNDYSDDDDEVTDAQLGQVNPVEIELSYRLTSSELSVFGSAEMMEHKKITLSQNSNTNSEQEHPETFIWNVFSRLKVLFKVMFFLWCTTH
jgi:hypothetical protein